MVEGLIENRIPETEFVVEPVYGKRVVVRTVGELEEAGITGNKRRAFMERHGLGYIMPDKTLRPVHPFYLQRGVVDCPVARDDGWVQDDKVWK